MRRRISYSRITAAAAAAVLMIFCFDFIRRKASSPPTDEELNNSIIVSEKDDGYSEQPQTENDQSDDMIEQPDFSDESGRSVRYHYITADRSEIGKGPLVLINNDHKIDSSVYIPDITSINSQKQTGSYKLAYMDLTADRSIISSLNMMFDDFYSKYSVKDVTVASSYVSFDGQSEKYSEKAGEYITSDDMFSPGCSEHQTGCAVDLLIVSDSMTITKFDGTGDYSWITSNCARYGFIQRYPTGKENKTGVSEMPGHFRYVGAPHSYIMHDRGITLEEYLDILKGYSYDTQHYIFETDDYEYEMYYVPAAAGKTEIPVPYEYQYSVSGNNTDGFIVTMSILKRSGKVLAEDEDDVLSDSEDPDLL